MAANSGSLLDENFDVELVRESYCGHIWSCYWDSVIQEKQFRIIDKRSRCNPLIDDSSSIDPTSIYITSSELEWLDYDVRLFPDDQSFPAGNRLPVQLKQFRGTLAERHAENKLIQSIIGDEIYEKLTLQIYKDTSICDLFRQVAALEGPDVFWGSFVDDEDQCRGKRAKNPPTIREGSSLTKFGTLTVVKFPFFAEIRFDDVDERYTFDLVRSLNDDSMEIVIEDLQELVRQNADEEIAEIRHKRIALRVASKMKTCVTVKKSKLGGRSTVVSGTVGVDQIDDKVIDGRPNRGFDCYLQELVYTNSLAARLYPVVATQGATLFLSDLFDDLDSMWESPLMNVLVEQIDRDSVDQEVRRRASVNAQKEYAFQRKVQCLDYDFHSKVYKNSNLTLISLSNLLKCEYPDVMSKLNLGPFPSSSLAQTLICVMYLRRCGRAAALWFMFWLEMAEANASKIPREVSIQINDFNSFLYRSDEVPSIPSLASFGFDRRFLRSKTLLKFWSRFQALKRFDDMRNIMDNTALRRECVSTTRMDILEIGGDPNVLPHINYHVVPTGGTKSDSEHVIDSANQLKDLISARIGSIFGEMVNERDEDTEFEDDEEGRSLAKHSDDIVGKLVESEHMTELLKKTKSKFMALSGRRMTRRASEAPRRIARRVSKMGQKDTPQILRLNKMLMVQDAEEEESEQGDQVSSASEAIDNRIAALKGRRRGGRRTSLRSRISSASGKSQITRGSENETLDTVKEKESVVRETEASVDSKKEDLDGDVEHHSHESRPGGPSSKFKLEDSSSGCYDSDDSDMMMDKGSEGGSRSSSAPSEAEIFDDVLDALNIAPINANNNDTEDTADKAMSIVSEVTPDTPVNNEDALVFEFGKGKDPGVISNTDRMAPSFSPWAMRTEGADYSFNCNPLKSLERVSQLDLERQHRARTWAVCQVLLPFVPQCQPDRAAASTANTRAIRAKA